VTAVFVAGVGRRRAARAERGMTTVLVAADPREVDVAAAPHRVGEA
jgi:hypothetical protein